MQRFNRPDLKPEVINWIKDVLSPYATKHNLDLDANYGKIEHIIDYFQHRANLEHINKISYPVAIAKADKWITKLNNQASVIVETEQDIEVKHDFKDGYKWVKLLSKDAYNREGKFMSHCVASYFGNKEVVILSLRDANNNPHCTLELVVKNKRVQQIKGKGNHHIHPNYIKYVIKFLKDIKMEVNDYEMENLGYIDLSKVDEDFFSFIEDNFKNVKFVSFNKKKYFYKYSNLKRA